MTKEPKDAVVLAARLAKAYPSLSACSAAALAEERARAHLHEQAQRLTNLARRLPRTAPGLRAFISTGAVAFSLRTGT